VPIDGDQLASLMIDHGVGVERGAMVEIVRVDHAFFEES
jgi:restriction endonuclease Mrr